MFSVESAPLEMPPALANKAVDNEFMYDLGIGRVFELRV
jgi:hypothetical protein